MTRLDQWIMCVKCMALVRGLAKALRKNFVPVPDFVGAALSKLTFAEGSLPERWFAPANRSGPW